MIKHLDPEKLRKHIEDGVIRQKWNEDHTLFTVNYTEKCTYENLWKEYEYALHCRGHVYDKDYNLVCPAMDKFFNYYQYQPEEKKNIFNWMRNTMFETTVKYDGCLSLIFPYDGRLIVTSKSTFDNYVVEVCRNIIKDKIFVNDLEDTSCGILCEVIAPETHQIVNYGDKREIRVITTYNLDDLTENPRNVTEKICEVLKVSVVESVSMDFDELQNWTETANWEQEGFVVRNLKTNERVKFKSEDYLRVSAIKGEVNYNHILSLAINTEGNWKETLNNMAQSIPDELQNEVKEIIKDITDNFNRIKQNILTEYEKVKDLSNKELGLSNNKYKNFIFFLRTNKDIDKGILKLIKSSTSATC